MFEGISGPELRQAVRRLVTRSTAAPKPLPVARLRALAQAQKFVGVRERGAPNDGPMVDAFTRADGLAGENYAWCQAFQNAMWRLATGGKLVRTVHADGRIEYAIRGGKMLANGTASVGLFIGWAKALNLIVQRPARGDHVAFQFGSDNWPDHVGQIERVISIGPIVIIQTIEGNTSSGEEGSQDEGDGVYRRRRAMRREKLIFVRVSTGKNP